MKAYKVLDVNTPIVGSPSCLQTTRASLVPHPSSQTVPQTPPRHISTLPSLEVLLPLRRISPSLKQFGAFREKGKKCSLNNRNIWMVVVSLQVNRNQSGNVIKECYPNSSLLENKGEKLKRKHTQTNKKHLFHHCLKMRPGLWICT